MSQTIWNTINPNTTSGTQLATQLDDFKNAVISNLSGTARPSEINPGGTWLDTTNAGTPNFYWSYKMYDGTNDIEIFRINLDTLDATIPSTGDFFEISKVSADIDGALLKFLKERVANNGQLLSGDTIMDIQAIGAADDNSNPVVGRIRVESTDNMTSTLQGSTIIFEVTPTGTATIQEVFRIVDQKMGIGTATPDTTLDVEGTGIQSKKIEDSVNPAEIIIQKKRATGFGTTQIGDSMGKISHKTTDDAGAVSPVLEIETVATENHTSTNQGTRVDIKNTDIGSAAPSTSMILGSEIEHIKPSKVNALELVSQDVASAATIIALDTTKTIVRLTGSIATEIQGIDATGNAKVLTIHNGSTADLTLKDQNAGATATDRLILAGAADLVIGSDQSVTLFYSTGDSRWKIKSSSVGGAGGSGEGGINYILDADAETSNNNVTVTGNILKAFETVAPLFGSQSHKFTVGTLATTADYFEFDMNDVDLAIVENGNRLIVSFWYKTDVNYTSDDVVLKLRDVDSSVDIDLVSEDAGNLKYSATSKLFTASCNVTDPDNTYSLRGYVVTAPTTDSNITMDKIKVGPDEIGVGYNAEDWTPFTPTANWTNINPLVGYWKRDGDTIHVEAKMSLTGVPTGGVLSIDWGTPLGLTRDSAKMASTGGSRIIGVSSFLESLSNQYEGKVIDGTPTTVNVTGSWQRNASGVVLNPVSTTSGDPLSWSANDAITVAFSYPVTGWVSSNAISSTQNMVQTAKSSTNGVIPTGAITSSLSKITFGTIDVDDQSLYNAGVWTAPKSGVVYVDAHVEFSYTAGTSITSVGRIVNTTTNKFVHGHYFHAATQNQAFLDPSGILEVSKGDTIEVQGSCDGTSPGIVSNARQSFSISYIQDFTVFGVYQKPDELKEGVSAGLVPFTITPTQYGDLTSITLTAGEWDISAMATYYSNGVTSTGLVFIGFSSDSGTLFSDETYGDNSNFTTKTTASTSGQYLAAHKRGIVLSSTTIINLKGKANGSNTNLEIAYKISARRIR